MNDAVAPIDVYGAALGATIVTVLGTPVLSLLVLSWFARSVRRSMSTTAGPAHPPPAGTAAVPVLPTPGIPVPGIPAPGPAESLGATARSRLRAAAGWYLAAGLGYALSSTVLWLLLSGQELLVFRVAVVGYVFAWPVVPTLALVCAWSWRTIGLAVAGYGAGMVLLGLFSFGGVAGPLALWALYMLPPSLVVAAVAPRRFRAAGPFLAPAVFMIGVALLVWPWIALAAAEAGASLELAQTIGIGVALLPTVAALLVIPVAAWRHRRKAASDQSVLVDQWWLLFALAQTMFTPQFGGRAVVLLLPYLGYLLVLRIGRRIGYRRALSTRPRQLLLLRVFGARGRSERLLAQVNAYWRYVGSVELIAGTDLARAVLEPHEFLDFLRGALSRRFIGDPAELARRLDGLDRRPDRDGRFRVNQFFCHENTWRPAVAALARTADVILIDLRGLGPDNDGVAYELALLARLGALGRTVGLVDRSTNRDFLAWVLNSSGARPPRTLEVGGRAVRPIELLAQLEAAAGDPAR